MVKRIKGKIRSYTVGHKCLYCKVIFKKKIGFLKKCRICGRVNYNK